MPDRGSSASVGEPGDPDGGVPPGARWRGGETEGSIAPTSDEHHRAKSTYRQRPAPERRPQLRPQPAEQTPQRDRILRAAGPLAGSLNGEHLLGEPASPSTEAESRATVRSHALNPRVSHASHEREEHHQHRWSISDSSMSTSKCKLWTSSCAS